MLQSLTFTWIVVEICLFDRSVVTRSVEEVRVTAPFYSMLVSV